MDRSFYEIYLEVELKDSYALRLISSYEVFTYIHQFHSLRIAHEDKNTSTVTIEFRCPARTSDNNSIDDISIQCKRYRRLFDERDQYIDAKGQKITRLGTMEYYADFVLLNTGRDSREDDIKTYQGILDQCNERLKEGKNENSG